MLEVKSGEGGRGNCGVSVGFNMNGDNVRYFIEMVMYNCNFYYFFLFRIEQKALIDHYLIENNRKLIID